MAKIQSKINFGNESLEKLIDEVIKDKIYEVRNRLKNGKYPSTNIEKRVDEIK